MNALTKETRRDRESDYWEWVAQEVYENGKIRVNIHKTEQILWRVLKTCSMIDQKVIEIGIGAGAVAAAINVIILGKWKFCCTDMSPTFVKNATENFRFMAHRADVTGLPGADGEFNRVLCFDSLEHVHPDDRTKGYAEIARVAAQGALLLINMPLSEDSFHDPEFDHPFGEPDFQMLKDAGFRLKSYEAYKVPLPDAARPSAFVVFERK